MSDTDHTLNLMRQRIVRLYKCAQCWGALVERWDGQHHVVECPQHCQPGGFVTAAFVERRKAESVVELAEVAANYPALDPRPKLSAEERRTARAVLFGEE